MPASTLLEPAHPFRLDKIAYTLYNREYMKTYDMSLFTKKIYDSSLQLFSVKTLADLFELNKSSSFYKIINRLIVSDVLVKVERDKYLLVNYTGGEFALAHFLYEPSYISFESALSYYGILSQFPHEVTSATLKQTRSKKLTGKQFGYYHLKKELFWGYIKENNYLIAEPEKALLDQVYLSTKGIKKSHLDEYDLSLIDKKKLQLYRQKFTQTKQFSKTLNILI